MNWLPVLLPFKTFLRIERNIYGELLIFFSGVRQMHWLESELHIFIHLCVLSMLYLCACPCMYVYIRHVRLCVNALVHISASMYVLNYRENRRLIMKIICAQRGRVFHWRRIAEVDDG